MKFVFTKDMHFRFGLPKPKGRNDLFFQDIDSKIDQVIEICKERGIEHWFTAGDIFDVKSPSKYTLPIVDENRKRLERIKYNGIKLYSNLGNHDLPFANVDNYRKSLFHTFVREGLIHRLDSTIREIEGVTFAGVDYRENIEEVMNELQILNEKTVDVILLHEHCIRKKGEMYGDHYLLYKDLSKLTNVDYLLCGHLHKGFPVETNPKGGPVIINPWGFTRLARDYYSVNNQHTPEVVIVDTMKGVETIPLKVRSFEETFIIDSLKGEVSHGINMRDFINKLEEFGTDSKDVYPEDIRELIEYYLE